MVQRIAHQVIQGGIQPFQDVAVDFGGLALDFELNFLTHLPSQIADKPWQPLYAVPKRTHAAGYDLVI